MGPEVRVFPDGLKAAAAAAEFFSLLASQEVSSKGVFTVGLSGGKTPRQMHGMLGSKPLSERIPWGKTHIFWVDERMVPPDHQDSNYGAARKDLLDRVRIPSANIHSIDTGLHPAGAAGLYEMQMMAFFEAMGLAEPVFDLVMLGMGADGHTASLFPDGELLRSSRWVLAVRGGLPPLDRITMSLAAINNSKACAFLVTGKEKAGTAAKIIRGEAPQLPAACVRPRERLMWFLDEEAAVDMASGS